MHCPLDEWPQIFPPFCLSDSFRGLATRDVVFLWGEERHPGDWEVTGRNHVIMVVESMGYLSLLMLFEYLSKSPAFLGFIGKINLIDQSRAPWEVEEAQLDSDVRDEQRRLKQQIGFEHSPSHSAAELMGNSSGRPQSGNHAQSGPAGAESKEPDDVEYVDGVADPIEIHGLRKVYRGSYRRPPTVAVQDLWYSV